MSEKTQTNKQTQQKVLIKIQLYIEPKKIKPEQSKLL